MSSASDESARLARQNSTAPYAYKKMSRDSRATPSAVAALFPPTKTDYDTPLLPKFTMIFKCEAAGCDETAKHVCSGCHKTRYCAPACQRVSWKSHKPACRARAAALNLDSIAASDARARQRAADAHDFPTAETRFQMAYAEHSEPRKLDLFELAVEAGSADAAHVLSEIVERGQYGSPRSSRRALELRLRAGELGRELSTIDAAEMLIKGNGVPVDRARGFAMLERLTERAEPHPVAASMLGAGIMSGDVKHLARRRAVELFETAARGGFKEGLYNFGQQFYLRAEYGDSDTDALDAVRAPRFTQGRTHAERQGLCGPPTPAQLRDYAEAASWFTRAAALGQKNAAHNLGNLYESGLGVRCDGVRARELFTQGLRAGYLPSATGLAGAHMRGFGGPVDVRTSIELLREAALRGCELARSTLNQVLASVGRD